MIEPLERRLHLVSQGAEREGNFVLWGDVCKPSLKFLRLMFSLFEEDNLWAFVCNQNLVRLHRFKEQCRFKMSCIPIHKLVLF